MQLKSDDVMMSHLVDQIEQYRSSNGYTQEQMAKLLDISPSGYRKIIRGETNRISATMLLRFCNLSKRFAYDLCGLSTDCSNLTHFFELSHEQQLFINSIIGFEYFFQQEKKEIAPDYITMFELTGNFTDGMVYDSTHVRKIDIAPYRDKFKDRIHCAIKITTNHLHPAYHRGDILLICQEPPRSGDTGIFIHRKTQAAYIRRFIQSEPCRLEPITDYGSTIYVDSDNEEDMNQWWKFGYVLTKVRVDVNQKQ